MSNGRLEMSVKKPLEGTDSNKGSHQRKEEANFYGPHFVECYIIKNGIVIARAKINVPIEH